jgi:uncharacterized membrane protein
MPDLDNITDQTIKTAKSKLINEHLKSKHWKNKFADGVTKFIGSWNFLIIQTTLITIWLVLNISGIVVFDRFPFIFLNLAMSLQAAYTAPIIMMSQNKESSLDRKKAELDYQINLLAEREIEEVIAYLEEIKGGLDQNADAITANFDELKQKIQTYHNNRSEVYKVNH